MSGCQVGVLARAMAGEVVPATVVSLMLLLLLLDWLWKWGQI